MLKILRFAFGGWFVGVGLQRGMLRPGMKQLLEHLHCIGATVVVSIKYRRIPSESEVNWMLGRAALHIYLRVRALRVRERPIFWARQVYTHSEKKWAAKVCEAMERIAGWKFIARLFSRSAVGPLLTR